MRVKADDIRRRALFDENNNANGPIVPVSTFFAPLRTSIVPVRGTGSATFTRATTATVTDHEGIIRRVLSGEARFHGARRVYNICNASQNLTTVGTPGWSAGINGAVVTATTCTFTNANSDVRWTSAAAGVSTKGKFRVSFDIWGDTTQLTPELLDNSDGSDATYITITVTATRTRYSFIADMSGSATFSGTLGFYFNRFSAIATPGAVVNITNILIEDVTGQSNTNPSEYVSTGVLSAPYHGANVDGVRYFDTTNGNTVASNVVTEATGTPISASTLLGFHAEGARTNIGLQSETLGSWTNGGASVTADNAASPDGATTADLLTGNRDLSDNRQIGFTPAAVVHTWSIWVRAGNASVCSIGIYDGAAFVVTTPTILSGPGSVALNGSNQVVISGLTSAWTKVQVVTNAAPVAIPHLLILYPGAVGSGAGQTTYFWGSQLEAASFASSYIPTTTAAVTRNADVLTYPTASNIAAATGTLSADVTRPTADTTSARWFGSDAGSNNRLESSTESSAYHMKYGDGGTIVSIDLGTPAANTKVNFSCRWSSSGCAAFIDGGSKATSATAPSIAFTSAFYIGAGLSGAGPFYGTIRNVRIWLHALSDSQVKAIS